MPGLSQLKRFNADILALGNEEKNRALRGEKPITVPYPKSIKDVNDSEDFALGMPETPEENVQTAAATGPEDFSDITGAATAVKNTVESAEQQKTPDVSNILAPQPLEDGVPDLSQFMDEPAQEEEVVESEEPPPIADMSLDDLLGGDFDEEQEEEQKEPQERSAPQEEPQESPQEETGAKSDEIAENEKPAEQAKDAADAESADFSVPDFDFGSLTAPDDMPQEKRADIQQGDISVAIPTTSDTTSQAAIPIETETATLQKKPEADGASVSDFSLPDFDNFDFGSLSTADETPQKKSGDERSTAISLGEDTVEEPIKKSEDTGSEIDTSEKAPETLTEAEPVHEERAPEIPSLEEHVGETAKEPNVLDDTFNFDLSAPDDFDKTDEAPASETGATREAAEESEAEPIEHFDTSEMEGLDFTVEDADKQPAEKDKASSETESDSDVSAEFEIPGFSDTAHAATDERGRIKMPAPALAPTKAAESDNLPENTLTDSQYEKFLANLNEYPLNVRIAVENLLVANEFTDDAEFEIVEKILNKAPARQVASSLEKMLDISIHVPRDFERRTAAEYDAYKSSFQYQLRNRIIPGIIFGVVLSAAAAGLFFFSRNFIYRPLRANNFYRQGYALLEADEYPQSEALFNRATEYQLQKRWFFRYARGYREKKQYQRAEQMYRNIINYFNHDKQAGIEYAQMEYMDLANYERAEEIARRDVLDWYINDRAGLLLLGDIYLEWATEKDSSKFEDARRQYASLVQLYGETDLYLSRMMRYFVRTDNLREVLQLKEHFYPKAKSLSAADWTELSGYLLDKLYGELAPEDEYLRTQIEDLRDMLDRAVAADPTNPTARYNLSRYFVNMHDSTRAIQTLERTIELFKTSDRIRRRDVYKQIDSYRLLGEQYTTGGEYLRAEEAYTSGITLYENENETNGFAGNEQIGRLYADMGDIDYFIRGDYDSAFREYSTAVSTNCDTPQIRYRLGFIQYSKNDYLGAINSFINAAKEAAGDNHLLLAMGNALALRGDSLAAEGYYERLIANLDRERAQRGILFPQVNADQAEIVDLYMKASNNLGVTLFKIAQRHGSSQRNAEAMTNLSVSMRAYDALTRNQETVVRLGGSNLAEQNMRYMSHPTPDYEPAIYTEIPRILTGEKELTQ